MQRNKFLLVFLLVTHFGYGQVTNRYLVLFKDKAGSPYQISKPEAFLSARSIARRTKQKIAITSSDLPVNATYVNALKQTGAKVLHTTKWFNGAVVDATTAQLDAIRNLAFFKGIERDIPMRRSTSSSRTAAVSQKLDGSLTEVDHGSMTAQLEMLGIPSLHREGIRGEGMLIAVLDGGFHRADQLLFMKHAYDENRILETYDFISRDTQVYDDHVHGLRVLSTIAAYQPGVMVGAAYKASFVLYRTENGSEETPYEEVTWLMAAERADSIGADILTASLGYNTFTNSEGNYTYENMDGKTATISRAARWASRKGILLVNAAGNYGSEKWKYIVAPADVDSVLAVGSVDLSGVYAAHSSIGPAYNGVIKPDVAAVGSGTVIGESIGTGNVSTGIGTSYAAPQIAGLCALIWQKYPQLTAQEVAGVIRKSGSQYVNPDVFLGYGIPSVSVALRVVEKEFIVLGNEEVHSAGLRVFPNPAGEELMIRMQPGDIGKRGRFSVFTLTGSRLYDEDKVTDRDNTLHVGGLSPGVYILVVETSEGRRAVRFLKE